MKMVCEGVVLSSAGCTLLFNHVGLYPVQLSKCTSIRLRASRQFCCMQPSFNRDKNFRISAPPSVKYHLQQRPLSRKEVRSLFLASFSSTSTSTPASPVDEECAEGPTVSVIVPVYNEVDNIPILIKRILSVMEKRGGLFEIVCIDDGSSDGTSRVLRAMAGEVDILKVVLLRRNFGQTAAMAAGFDHAAGDVVVSLDGDLQNDPEDIPRMLDCLLFGSKPEHPAQIGVRGTPRVDGGFDMVCGWRKDRKDRAVSRVLPSKAANWLIGKVTGVRLHDYGCSLKAYRSSLLSLLKMYGEMHRFLPALAAMEGASIAEMEVQHHPRMAGKSKYGLSRIPRVLLDLLTVFFLSRFRDRPMHFVGPLAGLCLLASGGFTTFFCYAFASAIQRYGSFVLAWSTCFGHLVAALELLIMGAQVLCLGLIGDLCMRTYYESQDRRVYRVREIIQ